MLYYITPFEFSRKSFLSSKNPIESNKELTNGFLLYDGLFNNQIFIDLNVKEDVYYAETKHIYKL
jgi:hypothetical protein